MEKKKLSNHSFFSINFHEDRNIIKTFPNNRYSDMKYWPDGGYGALTKVSEPQCKID